LFTSLHEYFWNELESQTVCPQIKRKKTTLGLCTSYCGYWIWGGWPFFWQMNCGEIPTSKVFVKQTRQWPLYKVINYLTINPLVMS